MKIQGLPNPGLPLVDPSGKVNQVWFQFFNSLVTALGAGGELNNVTANSIAVTGPITAQDASFSGNIKFGAYVASRFAQTGYILITDDTGTVRRLMVG